MPLSHKHRWNLVSIGFQFLTPVHKLIRMQGAVLAPKSWLLLYVENKQLAKASFKLTICFSISFIFSSFVESENEKCKNRAAPPNFPRVSWILTRGTTQKIWKGAFAQKWVREWDMVKVTQPFSETHFSCRKYVFAAFLGPSSAGRVFKWRGRYCPRIDARTGTKIAPSFRTRLKISPISPWRSSKLRNETSASD